MTEPASKFTDFRAGITAIDTDYVRPRLAASHLVVDAGRAAFVDTGTTHSLPTLLHSLEAKGIDRSAVDWVLTTHVHLDHAGGAGALMRELPNARCAVHPRGARHLAEPSKLVAGSMAVYGEDRYRALYGEILPIDAARILEAADGATIRLGGRELELIHTPGHALHHYCVVDAANALIFSGDTFGISYRDFDVDGRAFIFPTTTPVHFDPEALCKSVDRLMSYRPRSIFLTHYAEVTELERLAREMKERVLAFADLGLHCRDAPDRADKLRHGMFAMMAAWLDAHGYPRDDGKRHWLLDDDIELNCQGIENWLDRT
ncbi:MAG TPA: MBL fold metallo-hydrolase [Steroidobacteraceae bacterium]|nr:MBL fold metallo-hydrolase [Steroidobacteraceae bacterium]